MNELKGPKIYVILSIKEGEGFGFLQESSIVSCSLNGHTLQTDPCGIRSSPIYDSDLVWETDKKTLRSLRLQNVPIKISVLGVMGKKVGYFLLNLLTATPCPSHKSTAVGYSWQKLLGVSVDAKSSEPKLLLRLIVSDSETPNKQINQIKTPRSSFSLAIKSFRETTSNPMSAGTDVDTERDGKIFDTDVNIIQAVEKDKDSREIVKVIEEEIENSRVNLSANEEEQYKEEDVIPNSRFHNITFQSHDTSIRQSNNRDNISMENKRTKIDTTSDTSTLLSEAYNLKDSFLEEKRSSDVLHGHGDVSYKLKIEKGHLISPETREELIRKTVKALERWKEKQQILYAEKLKQSERLLLQRLEKEWRFREREQEKSVKECKRLSETLQEALKSVNERSNSLSIKENKLRLAKDELEMLYMTKYHELNEAARRMEDDYNHQTKLQHLTVAQLENKVQCLEETNRSYKEKLKFAENEMDRLKQNTSSKEDVNNLQHEKICLEKKLEATLKSKAFFKDQWVNAVREANILKLKYSTNVGLSQPDSASYRFEELLQNEATFLQFDNISLRKLKDDIIHSERSDSHFEELRKEEREPSLKLDFGSPSKKSVSYKSDASFLI